MPFDKESMKNKLKKKTELKEKIKEGVITKYEAKYESKLFNSSLDKYGICEPDVIAHWSLDDVD